MTRKYPPRKPFQQKANAPSDRHESRFISSFYSSDPIEAEREAQRKEFLRKNQNEDEDFAEQEFPEKPYKTPQQKQTKRTSSKNCSLEENLERTWAWLSKTFPDLFALQSEIKPLDLHILRDIKAHYKTYQAKKQYPPDLVIKAALYRYMEKPEYLLRLQEGAFRYNIDGNPTQNITQEDQEEAIKKLKEMKIIM